MGLILRLLLNAVSLLIVGRLGIGVSVRGFGSALLAALVWGLVNAVLKPVLLLLSLPLNILTLGLFTLVVNGFLLYLVGLLTPGFTVHGFFGAVFGALLLSVISFLLSLIVRL